ncbi:Peroxisomal NADH pyrophosphatase NUDT12 [Takifugu flavidus]|uniref:NAD(+) diphosphatase n=1 Tax=Takifugu flavidus TaxID=433684 RepID=A0A5C6MZP0_9TELE|nr:Peroxisomal NADH pyrophosphatase NUDT12 [Takifugu flavidus]
MNHEHGWQNSSWPTAARGKRTRAGTCNSYSIRRRIDGKTPKAPNSDEGGRRPRHVRSSTARPHGDPVRRPGGGPGGGSASQVTQHGVEAVKNLLEAESCCAEIRKLEGAGYVSRVSPEEVSKSSEFWFIPHHVVHQNGKDRVFFDCIFHDRGQSLNELLRFHQNSVVVICNPNSVLGTCPQRYSQVLADNFWLTFIQRDLPNLEAATMASFPLSAKEEIVERFLDAAVRGDLPQLRMLLTHTPSLINQTGYSGWTALMLAARNGHYNVVEALLSHGCDKLPVNSSSQTAYDIAKFWGHSHISNLLAQTDDRCSGVLPELYFCRETLDRQSDKRTDKAWLEAQQSDPNTVYLLFSNVNPMVSRCEEDKSSEVLNKLCRFRYDGVKDLFQKPTTKLIFLGVEKMNSSSSCSQVQEGSWEPPAWFAIGTDEDATDLLKRCRGNKCFFTTFSPKIDLLTFSEEEAGPAATTGTRDLASTAQNYPISIGGREHDSLRLNVPSLPWDLHDAVLDVGVEDLPGRGLRIVAHARAVLVWHNRYSFCPICGSGTSVEEGGHKRRCLNLKCRSLKGVYNTCYPKIDPVVIMLVVHPGRNQCLLGRKKSYPVGMFSCLAGFIEPGEAIEDAVRREVEAESGVKVGLVRYICSQPWPMPSNLMIGCLAIATSTNIKVDQNEIEEARWFTRQQIAESLYRGANPALMLPPNQTISHKLIRYWICKNANLSYRPPLDI